MTTVLILVALIAQTADATLACRNLARGARELNPVMPQSCAGIVAIKSGAFVAGFAVPGMNKKLWFGTLAVSGGVGVGLTLALK